MIGCIFSLAEGALLRVVRAFVKYSCFRIPSYPFFVLVHSYWYKSSRTQGDLTVMNKESGYQEERGGGGGGTFADWVFNDTSTCGSLTGMAELEQKASASALEDQPVPLKMGVFINFSLFLFYLFYFLCLIELNTSCGNIINIFKVWKSRILYILQNNPSEQKTKQKLANNYLFSAITD